MNTSVTSARTSSTQRVLVLLLTAGAFAFTACGTDTEASQVASPDKASTGKASTEWEGTLYPRPFGPDAKPHDDESVRAPRAMGGDPTLPTGTQPPGSVV